jgi:hypothetical protein
LSFGEWREERVESPLDSDDVFLHWICAPELTVETMFADLMLRDGGWVRLSPPGDTGFDGAGFK